MVPGSHENSVAREGMRSQAVPSSGFDQEEATGSDVPFETGTGESLEAGGEGGRVGCRGSPDESQCWPGPRRWPWQWTAVGGGWGQGSLDRTHGKVAVWGQAPAWVLLPSSQSWEFWPGIQDGGVESLALLSC